MSLTPTSRKERDRRLREDDFLNAAEQLFADQGYFQTSMEDVARKAEYATGTIYRYFNSKEALYHSLLRRKGLAYFERIQADVGAANTPVERLRAALRSKVDFFFTHRAFVRIYLHDLARPAAGTTVEPPEELRDVHAEYLELLRTILSDGMKKGVFRKLNVDLTLGAVLGISNELLAQSLQEGFALSQDDVEHYLFDFLEQAIMTTKGRK
jgi:AcrR family transcriptional regulator